MINNKSFGIVGAGIGGLTLAVALQRRGYGVTVYENAPEFKTLGAGIVLAANARKALKAIGLDADIMEAGKELNAFLIQDARGKTLTSTNAEKLNQKYGVSSALSLHRAELHEKLVGYLRPGTIQFNKGLSSFEDSGNQVQLNFKDGTTTLENFVIAADGIHSIIRKKLLPHVKLRYSGYTCWRAVTDSVPGFDHNAAAETWGSGERFGMVPLKHNRTYWYATIDSPPNDPAIGNYSISDLQSRFGDFPEPVSQLIASTKPAQLIKNDICDFVPLKRFAFGRVVLIGDAAHATTPNLGQGACMAIEDAVVLANLIDRYSDAADAFKAFEKARIARTTKIVKASFSMGRIAQIQNPILIKLRNMAMRFAPESLSEKQLKFLYEVPLT